MFSFFKKNNNLPEKEYYFGLILKENDGVGMILEIDKLSKKVSVFDLKKFTFSNHWEAIVEDVDGVISELEEANKIKTTNAIFFVYSHFLEKGITKVKKQYLDKIKKICKELALKPLGFIPFHESVISYLKKKEQTALTGILIELDSNNLTLYVLKGGDVFYEEKIDSSTDFILDLENIFAKISGNLVLPSRIIIYDSDKIEKESTRIITHNWDSKLFIQIPRVEIINEEKLKQSVIDSFTDQLFYEEKNINQEEVLDDQTGFLIEEDISEDEQLNPKDFLKKTEDSYETKEENQEVSYKETLRTEEVDIKNKNFFLFFKPFFSKINNATYFLKNFTFSNTKNTYIIGALGLFFLIVIISFGFFYFFYKADITVYLDSQKIQKEIDLSKEIQFLVKEDEVDKTETLTTTGKKTIGEKAKGDVTVYSYFSGEKTLKKGTIVTTESGIKFVLNEDVKTASASESLGQKQAGKQKTTLVAYDIGPAANIDKNVKMKVEDYSTDDIYVVSDSTFTGGVKKDIQVVSVNDIAKLRTIVLDNVKNESGPLVSIDQKNEKIIDNLTKTEISSEKFSKEAGEEATSVIITAKVKKTFYTVSNSQIKDIIKNSISSEILSGYEVLPANIAFDVSKAEYDKKGNLTFIITSSSKSTYIVDKQKIIADAKGKDITEFEKLIKDKYKAKNLNINSISPTLIFRDKLPFFEKNITLRVESY